MGKPTAEQLARINQLAKSPLTEDQVYVFSNKMIGDNIIPKYNLKLSPNVLQKFCQQTKDGIALLVDHPWVKWEAKAIPYGRTFDGNLQTDGDELALYGDNYMVMGQEFDGISTDSLASAIDAGTIFDTSLGFQTYKHTCSICGQDYFNSDCMHMSGQTYDGKLCYKVAEDGDLMENSLVFDGAYEGAGIVNLNKSKNHTEPVSDWIPLDPTTKSIPDGRIFYAFSARSGVQGYICNSTFNNQLERNDNVNELEQTKQALSTANTQLQVTSTLLAKIREGLKVNSDDAIESALSQLLENAKLGETYKNKVIEEACGAGVRAMGDAFSMDSMKLAFSNLPVTEVEKIRDTYEAQAKTALGGGGRHTLGAESDLPNNPSKNVQSKSDDNLTQEEKLAKAREEARAALSKHSKHLLKDGE